MPNLEHEKRSVLAEFASATGKIEMLQAVPLGERSVLWGELYGTLGKYCLTSIC